MIKTQPLAKPSEEELHQAMLNGIREKGLSVLTDAGVGAAASAATLRGAVAAGGGVAGR